MSIFSHLFESPLNTGVALAYILVFIAIIFLLNEWGNNSESSARASAIEEFEIPPPLEKHDMIFAELNQYNGKGNDKRICIAIKGRVYDCTKGYHLYGPGGPYESLAGHDITCALSVNDMNAVSDKYNKMIKYNHTSMGLTDAENESVNEWIEQFNEQYDYIGKLNRLTDSEYVKNHVSSVKLYHGNESGSTHRISKPRDLRNCLFFESEYDKMETVIVSLTSTEIKELMKFGKYIPSRHMNDLDWLFKHEYWRNRFNEYYVPKTGFCNCM